MAVLVLTLLLSALVINTIPAVAPAEVVPSIESRKSFNQREKQITKDAGTLADAFNSGAYVAIKQEHITNVYNTLKSRYNTATLQDVLDIAIPKITKFDQIHTLAQIIHRTGNKDDSFLLERMAAMQLSLYWRQKKYNPTNDKYITVVRKHFQQIKSWGYTNNNMKFSVEKAIKDLAKS